MQDLGTLAGYTDSYAAAINSSGQVVGYAVDNGSGGLPDHAFIYANGQMTDLNSIPSCRLELGALHRDGHQ